MLFPTAGLTRTADSIMLKLPEYDFVMHAGGAFCVLASLPKPQAVLPVFLEDLVEVPAGAGHSRMPSAEGTPQVLHSTRREVPFFPARAWCTATKAQRMQVNAITLGVIFQGASTPSTFSGRHSASVS